MDRVLNDSVSRHPSPRRGRFRRAVPAVRGTPGPSFLVESRSREAVSHRERIFRRALVSADVVAGLLTVALALRVFGSAGPGPAALALLPVIVVINATSGLYNRDELLLRKSTLDEAPDYFQATTLTTVVDYLLDSALLDTPIGARL
jgi:hypothetical protein